MRRQEKGRQEKERYYTVGEFWLDEPQGRYKSFRIRWFNKSKRQTDGISCDTTDPIVAKAKIHKHHLNNSNGQKLKDEPVLSSMQRYYDKIACKQAQEQTFALAMADVIRLLVSPMVSEMTAAKQMELIEAYRKESYKDTTIIRRMKCIWASMRYAAEFEHLDSTVIPALLSIKRWNAKKGETKRLLSHQEMGKLLDAACSVFRSHRKPCLCRPSSRRPTYHVRWIDPITGKPIQRSLFTTDREEAKKQYHEIVTWFKAQYPDGWEINYDSVNWRFLIIALGSGARKRAITDLTLKQIEQVTSEYSLLNLNPEGRVQTSKYRPTIPIAHTFGRWLKSWEPITAKGHFVAYKDAVNHVGGSVFRKLSQAAGCKVTAHMIRHYVSTWLSHSTDVSAWERDMFMGWKRPEGSAMAGVYSHYNPKYLREAALAIEALFAALAPYTFADVTFRGFHDQPLPEDAWTEVPDLKIDTVPNSIALFPARSWPVKGLPQEGTQAR